MRNEKRKMKNEKCIKLINATCDMLNVTCKKAFLALLSLMLSSMLLNAQEDEWLTHYEKSNYLETPRYVETIEYCQKLADASPWIKYTSFGISPQGRELPLIIVDKNQNFDPEKVKESGNVVLLIEAGIHPGEIDGKDAGLMFIRDLVIHKKFPDLLNHLTIMFIPIFNVDGHERFGPYNRINQNGPEEMGWRTNAENLNLNRDFLKADAPEMQAWLKLFSQWLPDFFVDIHASDGADFQYVTTYILEIYGNMDPGLTEWTKEKFIPVMTEEMEEKNFPVFRYVGFRTWFDPESGISSSASAPRYSSGYAAIQNRASIVVENHMLKDYKTRVSGTYELIRIICSILNEDAEKIKELNEQADLYAASEEFLKKAFPLSFSTTSDSIIVDFRGFEYEIIESDLVGGRIYSYTDIPAIHRIPIFETQVVQDSVFLPKAYIYPPEWIFITERLDWHGIKYKVLEKSKSINVETYKFNSPRWGRSPYEGRFTLRCNYNVITEEQEYPAGSIIVPVNQRTSRIIAHMLEPDGPDSFLAWGFFNAIFEQKEYVETYLMEPMAREMLKEDPELEKDFEKWKEENPDQARIPWYQLNWLFSKTPYWDQKKNVYPVGRILD